eukprot:4280791-Amphidinium_carterae.2
MLGQIVVPNHGAQNGQERSVSGPCWPRERNVFFMWSRMLVLKSGLCSRMQRPRRLHLKQVPHATLLEG